MTIGSRPISELSVVVASPAPKCGRTVSSSLYRTGVVPSGFDFLGPIDGNGRGRHCRRVSMSWRHCGRTGLRTRIGRRESWSSRMGWRVGWCRCRAARPKAQRCCVILAIVYGTNSNGISITWLGIFTPTVNTVAAD
jgi:hypothetical protein